MSSVGPFWLRGSADLVGEGDRIITMTGRPRGPGLGRMNPKSLTETVRAQHSQGCRKAFAHRATTLVHKGLGVVPELARRDVHHGTNRLLVRVPALGEILTFGAEPFADSPGW